MPLIAYNINLSTSSVEIAQKIADKIRNIKGGFKYCKAMGVLLENKEDPSKNRFQLIKSGFQLMKPHKAPFELCFPALC